MNKIIYTVPHSGTHFVANLMEKLGMRKSIDFHIAHAHYNQPKNFVNFYDSKFIVTLRHPHDTVKTHLAITPPRGQQLMLDEFVHCWKAFIDMLPNIDYRMVKLNSPNLFEQLQDAAFHFGQEDVSLIKQYANMNVPVNSKKREYELIDLDYSELEFAVEWYDNKIT